MNKFVISRDDLDDLLARLWEYCQGKGSFRVIPDEDLIEVYENVGDGNNFLGKVAEIEIVSVDDVFDVKELLFKKE